MPRTNTVFIGFRVIKIEMKKKGKVVEKRRRRRREGGGVGIYLGKLMKHEGC